MAKKLLLAGGGHAHMTLLAQIRHLTEKGHGVTVLQPSKHHYCSDVGPGILYSFYTADDIRFKTRFVVKYQKRKFIRDKVIRIDADNQFVERESEICEEYNVLSCNSGSKLMKNSSSAIQCIARHYFQGKNITLQPSPLFSTSNLPIEQDKGLLVYGALQKGPFYWSGKASSANRDYIDKKFMARFQNLKKDGTKCTQRGGTHIGD